MSNKASSLLRREALAIAGKLGADIVRKTEHDFAFVKHDGALIAHFGIRRGKREPHIHIPKQLFVSASQAASLANCTMSKDSWLTIVKEMGKI